MTTISSLRPDHRSSTSTLERSIDMCQHVSDTLVTVVIPAYNCGREIEAAVTSALRQNGVSTELILVNDGSTDDTAQALLEIKQRHPESVRILSQKNRGQRQP